MVATNSGEAQNVQIVGMASGSGDPNLTNGTAIFQVRGSSKGATVAANVTSTSSSTDHQGLDVVEQFKPVAEDNTNGVIAVITKPLAVSTYTPSLFTNLGANNTLNVKASAGNVFSAYCQNINAAVRYLQLFDTATVPVNTNVPKLSFAIPASSSLLINNTFFSTSGLNFATGIAFAFSSTNATLTLATASDHSTHVVYI